jgi:hypothetical protein
MSRCQGIGALVGPETPRGRRLRRVLAQRARILTGWENANNGGITCGCVSVYGSRKYAGQIEQTDSLERMLDIW